MVVFYGILGFFALLLGITYMVHKNNNVDA